MVRQLLLNQKDWNKTALYVGDQQISFAVLKEKALTVQAQLMSNQGGNVAIFLSNGGDYISAFFGVLMAGMTVFPLNIQLTGCEITPLLEQASVHTIITSKAHHEVVTLAAAKAVNPPLVLCIEDLPAGTTEPRELPPAVDADEVMVLLTTSGTTGKAKLVQLSERNIASCVQGYIDDMDYEKLPASQIRYILATPFSTAYGVMIITLCMMSSYPIVVLPPVITLDMVYKAIERYRVTHFEGGPSINVMMAQMADRPLPYDISSLLYVGVGGSKTTADTLRILMKAYPGVDFWCGYGMTEASPLITKPHKKTNPDKLDAVGTPITGVAVMIATDGGITDTPHIRGEILVKGPTVMLGYYNNEEETNRIIKNGYLYTGDIGYLDEDGYLYICGRKKHVIMARGFSVYVEEVEASISNCNLVKDCLVYGETDETGNEIVCAKVVPVSPEIRAEQIHTYCQAHLAGYKQPRRVQLVAAIKKTATNKVERDAAINGCD